MKRFRILIHRVLLGTIIVVGLGSIVFGCIYIAKSIDTAVFRNPND